MPPGERSAIAFARVTGLMPNETESARLLAAANLPSIREPLIVAASTRHGAGDLMVWTHVAQHAPHDAERGGAVHMTAFAAWLRGDGALGWAALDTAQGEGCQESEVSRVVADALTNATDPRTWNTED